MLLPLSFASQADIVLLWIYPFWPNSATCTLYKLLLLSIKWNCSDRIPPWCLCACSHTVAMNLSILRSSTAEEASKPPEFLIRPCRPIGIWALQEGSWHLLFSHNFSWPDYKVWACNPLTLRNVKKKLSTFLDHISLKPLSRPNFLGPRDSRVGNELAVNLTSPSLLQGSKCFPYGQKKSQSIELGLNYELCTVWPKTCEKGVYVW